MNTTQPPSRIALYVRVSSEDQAERQTIQSQISFLQQWASLMGRTVVELYSDDGVSGTIPINDRPASKRLLQDAKAGRFQAVVMYRLDRLGRSLRVLLDAYGDLDGAGVTLQSATEPFDTSSPIGRFVFQLLASIAELERETIVERTSMGRARVARAGRWVGAPVPYGYVLDDDGQLTPATALTCAMGGEPATEADVVRLIFREICGGSSCIRIATLLNALGVPAHYKFQSRGSAPELRRTAEPWHFHKVRNIIASAIYVGRHVYRLRSGEEIERQYPPLIAEDDWQQAQRQLTANRNLATRNAKRNHLLRGLIRCGNCGANYSGGTLNPRGVISYYYRCNNQATHTAPKSAGCIGKMIRAETIEAAVWEQIERFIQEPAPALERGRRELREREEQAPPDLPMIAAELESGLSANERGRDRLMELYRRDIIELPDLERQMAALRAESVMLRDRLAALTVSKQQQRSEVDYLATLPAILAVLRAELPEAAMDTAEQRRIIELAVTQLTVTTSGAGRRKVAAIDASFRWGNAVVL